MATSTKHTLRELWFQVHKWIGLALAILIIPLCLTGSALVWDDVLNRLANPQPTVTGRPALPLSAYAASARAQAQPGESLISLTLPRGDGAVSATVGAPPKGPGRPMRATLLLDPADGHVLSRSMMGGGFVGLIHGLHGSLMIPGVGRQIVGWIGVAMLISSLTGLWLWWPFKGGLGRGLRWKRSPDLSGNLHHQGGFWISLPLAVLSLTGAWISFPAFFAAMSGDSPAQGGDRGRQMAAMPIAAPKLSPDEALRLAATIGTGSPSTISWPAEPSALWKVTYRGVGDVGVNDATRVVSPPPPQPPETIGRLMRRIHGGDDMGIVWQTIIFIGGLIPAALAVTGVIMWWNTRMRKTAMSRRHEKRRGDLSAPGPINLDESGASI